VEDAVPAWIRYLIAAVVCVLIAVLLAPVIPYPGSTIVAVVAWIGAAVAAIYAVVALVRGGPRL
jgi:hypothetical protein